MTQGNGSHAAFLKNEARAFLNAYRQRSHEAPPIGQSQAVLLALTFVAAIAMIAWMFDSAIAKAVRDLPFGFYRVFSQITLIGTSGYIFALSALIALAALVASRPPHTQRVREGLRLLAGRAMLVFIVALTSGLASQIVKHTVGRARPRLLDDVGAFHFDPLTFRATLASFPSGHTVTAFAIAWTLGLLLPSWRIPLFLTAILVAISRVVIGSHYPGDVLAGAGLGVVVAWLTCRAFAGRRLVLHYTDEGMAPRGRGLVFPALRALFGAGKASA